MRAVVLLALVLCALVGARTSEEKEAMQKAIRMKTSCAARSPPARMRRVVCAHAEAGCARAWLARRRQLKEIFDELGIEHKGLSKDDLKKLAYKENAVGRWEELHPEKKRKPPKGDGGFGGIPGMDGFGGGDPKMEELLRQMKGDFSAEKDPERRRILEKLAKRGMSFGGGNNMDTEQLRQMEKMLHGLGDLKGGGGGGGADGEPERTTSEMDEEAIGEEDKMEL